MDNLSSQLRRQTEVRGKSVHAWTHEARKFFVLPARFDNSSLLRLRRFCGVLDA